MLKEVKEKMTIDEVLRLVEQIAEVTNCTRAEALEKVEEARKTAVA